MGPEILTTIGQKFDARSNNFDLLRLLAATLVVVSHSFSLLGQREPVAYWLGGYDTGGGWAVSIFFVISGFLIARSCLERPLTTYLSARVVRIVPALAVLLLFDVFIIGPLFTQMPISGYFTNPDTFKHLTSISIFYQRTGLPGVFGVGSVNGTIWTLPIEFACYLVLPLLLFIGFLKRWMVLIPTAVVTYLYISARNNGLDWSNQGGLIFYGLPYYSTLKNALFFMIGAAMWVHRDDIPLSSRCALFAVMVLVGGAFGYFKAAAFYVGLSYLTIYVSIAYPVKLDLHKKVGDLSYGIYLYGFPVQQALIAADDNNLITPASLALFSLPIVYAMAYFSWWGVEKPCLNRLRSRQQSSSNVPDTIAASAIVS